jgi:hypothetical protein
MPSCLLSFVLVSKLIFSSPFENAVYLLFCNAKHLAIGGIFQKLVNILLT